MHKKLIKTMFIALVIVIAGASILVYREYNRKSKDVAHVSAAFTLKAADVINTFAKDEKAANKKYLDKVLAIEGTVKTIDKDEQGFYTIVLGDTGSSTSVRCSMDSIHNTEATTVSAGTKIIVKGICTGFNADELLGSDLLLNRCALNK